jgi:hypothetical protein
VLGATHGELVRVCMSVPMPIIESGRHHYPIPEQAFLPFDRCMSPMPSNTTQKDCPAACASVDANYLTVQDWRNGWKPGAISAEAALAKRGARNMAGRFHPHSPFRPRSTNGTKAKIRSSMTKWGCWIFSGSSWANAGPAGRSLRRRTWAERWHLQEQRIDLLDSTSLVDGLQFLNLLEGFPTCSRSC